MQKLTVLPVLKRVKPIRSHEIWILKGFLVILKHNIPVYAGLKLILKR